MILKNQSIPLTESEKNYKNISSKEYRLYKNEVRRISKKSIKEVFKNWEGYDFYDNEYIKDFLCLAHTDDRYPSIDHKVSIYYGYKNNIDPLIIADVENLCITKRFINSSKRHLLDSEYKIN